MSSASAQNPPLIKWHTRFNTGHPQIDAQHRELVELLNRFSADLDTGGEHHAPLFRLFSEALRKHFVFEEEVLRRLSIPLHLLNEHIAHHRESVQLLDGLFDELEQSPKEQSLKVLAEITHCLMEDLVDEDRYVFVSESVRSTSWGTPPVAPVLHAFGRLVEMLNQQNDRVTDARNYYLTLLIDFPTPVFRSAEDGRFDWFNRTWLTFTGQMLDDAYGYGWIRAVHGEERSQFVAAWEKCVRDRMSFAMDYRIENAEGGLSWVHHVGQPFFDGEGNFLGHICTLFDITERRRNEASLRVSAQVFEHATEAIMITDPSGRIEAINPAFTAITGYTADEAIGASASVLRSDFHDTSFYRDMWASVLNGGEWKGEVVNRRKNGELFPVWLSISRVLGEDGTILRLVGVLTDITPLRTSRDHLKHLAHHDALTDLPNRLLFGARAEHSMERCARESSRLAVLFIDLDNFKPINDRLGHKVGDETLCRIAPLLESALREEDTVARLGGDEFVVLVERVGRADDVLLVAEKLRGVFPLQVGDGAESLQVTASIGISLYPDDGRDIDTLLEVADKAMYRAKQAGGNRVCRLAD
ncbi:MAG: diguanylate cyclase [Rhodocyclaceae bacterium]|nr:diguanylate cyclase [Rhodocyclaceae bacterium]